jgi:ferredoxin-type protein NapH
MKNGKSLRIRLAVMLGFMVIVAVGYFVAGGIGNVCGIGFDTITLICPLGALLVMLAERTAIPLAVISVVVAILLCALLGKVFCSWGCAVHFLTRLSKPRSKKVSSKVGQPSRGTACTACAVACDTSLGASPGASQGASQGDPQGASQGDAQSVSRFASFRALFSRLRLDSRHGILASALLATLIFGFPVFCLVCPVGLIFATVLLVMRLFVFGETTWTLIIFPLIIAVELFLLPRWCNNFCPLGALLSLFSGLNRTFLPQINNKTCLRTAQKTSCNLCERVCPESINLHDIKAGKTALNDCSKCRACADICPENAISFPLWAKRSAAKIKTTNKGG